MNSGEETMMRGTLSRQSTSRPSLGRGQRTQEVRDLVAGRRVKVEGRGGGRGRLWEMLVVLVAGRPVTAVLFHKKLCGCRSVGLVCPLHYFMLCL